MKNRTPWQWLTLSLLGVGVGYAIGRTALFEECEVYPMNEENQKISEASFFRMELDKMIRGRYGNLTCWETIGVLEYVKKGILDGMQKAPEQQNPKP